MRMPLFSLQKFLEAGFLDSNTSIESIQYKMLNYSPQILSHVALL